MRILTPNYVDNSQTSYFEGSPPTVNNWSQNYGNDVRERTSNPGYRVAIAKHQDASSPYHREVHNAEWALVTDSGYTYVSGKRYAVGGSTRCSGGLYFPVSLPSNGNTIAAEDIALKRLKAKLATDVGAFKSLVPLGEYKELRGMVHSSSEVTADFLKAAITIKQRGGIRRMRKALSQLWLQYSFAVAPTIGAISDLSESIVKTLDRDHVITQYGQKTVRWQENQPRGGPYGHHTGASLYSSGAQLSHSYRVRYTAGHLVRIQSLNNYRSDHFGFTSKDVISAAYELTPFSWVADYFSNMGDVLEDVFSGLSGSTFYCTKSVKYERHTQCHVSSVWTPPSYGTVGHGTTRAYDMIFDRSVMGTIPHRSFRIKSMDEIRTNAIPKLLNLVSILGSK